MADLSFDDIRGKIRDQLDARAKGNGMEPYAGSHWIVEVYPKYFICDKDGTLYKTPYQTKGDGVVVDFEAAEEVERAYVPVEQASLDLYMAERYPGFPSWSSVDKTSLPSAAFLVVPDQEHRSTWKLPYKYKNDSGQFVTHPKGVLAAWQAIVGAHTGKPMKITPSLKAKMRALYQKYWGDDDD